MRKLRRFTPEEDARLVALRLIHCGSNGQPRADGGNGGLRTIGKILGRRHSSVRHRLIYLAERDEEADA